MRTHSRRITPPSDIRDATFHIPNSLRLRPVFVSLRRVFEHERMRRSGRRLYNRPRGSSCSLFSIHFLHAHEYRRSRNYSRSPRCLAGNRKFLRRFHRRGSSLIGNDFTSGATIAHTCIDFLIICPRFWVDIREMRGDIVKRRHHFCSHLVIFGLSNSMILVERRVESTLRSIYGGKRVFLCQPHGGGAGSFLLPGFEHYVYVLPFVLFPCTGASGHQPFS